VQVTIKDNIEDRTQQPIIQAHNIFS